MTAKILIAILLLGLPVAAEDWNFPPNCYNYTPKDTSRYYVVEVKEKTKCDTCLVSAPCPDPSYAERGMSCLVIHQRRVVVCDDTTWAPKVQVWLTPEQLRGLTKLLENTLTEEDIAKIAEQMMGVWLDTPINKLKE